MIRPASIVRFEQLYGGAIALGLVNTALSWSANRAMLDAQPALAGVATWYQPVVAVVGVAIQLLLWYFVARRGSAVAKWILVVLTGLGVAALLFGFLLGRTVDGLAGGLALIAILLSVGSVVMLFRPDTRAWFGETKGPGKDIIV